MDREMRFMKVLEGIMGKYEVLENRNKEMKNRFQEYEHVIKANKMKKGTGKYEMGKLDQGKMCQLCIRCNLRI